MRYVKLRTYSAVGVVVGQGVSVDKIHEVPVRASQLYSLYANTRFGNNMHMVVAVASTRVALYIIVFCVSALTLAQVGGLLEVSHVPPVGILTAFFSSRKTQSRDPVQVAEAGVHVRSVGRVAQRTSSAADRRGVIILLRPGPASGLWDSSVVSVSDSHRLSAGLARADL